MEEFRNHIDALRPNDWNRLFALLPEIEDTTIFGEVKESEIREDRSFSFPYWISHDVVDKVVNTISELNLMPVFDWNNWKEGRSILNNPSFDYKTLDTITLCKLFTVIIRANRFNDGYLVSCFKNGIVPKIIKAIRQNETKNV